MAISFSAAEAAQVRWQGVFKVTASNGECPSDPVGYDAVVRFKPPVTPDNGAGSSLSLFGRNETQAYALKKGEFNKNFKEVDTISVRDGFKPFDGVAEVRFEEIEPGQVSRNTPFISVLGAIRGFDNMQDCTAKFRMNLIRQPG